MHSCVQGFSNLDTSQSISLHLTLPDLPVYRPTTNWQILGHGISCWLDMCKGMVQRGCLGFLKFYFTGWESLSETVAKTEWWDVWRQQWWLYRIHTHTWAYAHINIAARACGRQIYAWGHSLVHAWMYKCMWMQTHIQKHRLSIFQNYLHDIWV